MHLPARIGDYTDFYVGIHHATNVGKLFRPDNPLLPNYKHVPIGYHGRRLVCPVRRSVRRPTGQLKPAAEAPPFVVPAQPFDYELELGIWIGPGNDLGIHSDRKGRGHIAGFCLLNDWSARDVQAWEYQPLGPFLSKNFATTVSPWVVTPEALAPFRAAQQTRPEGDPAPLPYLLDETDQASGAFDIELEVLLITPALSRKGLLHTGWHYPTRATCTGPRPMVAHHTREDAISIRRPVRLRDHIGADPTALVAFWSHPRRQESNPPGDRRRPAFLEDGDEIILRATAKAGQSRSASANAWRRSSPPTRPADHDP